MATRVLGERLPRVEDERMLTGRGRYVDDFDSQSAHAAFVRSDGAHVRITAIDTSAAAAMEGVHAVLTHHDLDGAVAERLPLLFPNPGLTSPRTQYALARDEVCYSGEIIAMVVAKDRYIAEDAASAVVVQSEALPAVARLAVAVRPEAPIVHSDLADNIAGGMVEERGDVDAALAGASHVFQFRFALERSAAMPMETRAVLAQYDSSDDRLLVYDTTQAPTTIRAGLATLFQMDPEKLHVVAPNIGGGFGVKVMLFYPEEVLVPWAARRLGFTVKWVEDRREHFIGSNHERGQIHDVRVGVDAEGRLVALETVFVHDTGAYCPYGMMLPIVTAGTLPGPYKIENYRYRFRSVYTNTVPTSPYRGSGRPHAVFVMERVMDRVAQALQLDRAEVRRKNMIQPDEFPYNVGITFQDGGPTIYDSGNYPRALAMLLDSIGYAGFPEEQARARAEGRVLGLGIGCYVEGTGVGPYEGASVTVSADGMVRVASGISTQGQSHETVFAQIVAQELGLPIERVQVETGDTRRLGYGAGTYASRSAVVAGSAVLKAARDVRRQALELASRILEAATEDLNLDNGDVIVSGDPDRRLSLAQLAVLANPVRSPVGIIAQSVAGLAGRVRGADEPPLREGTEPGLTATGYFSPMTGVFAYGMHGAVVEVDRWTCGLSIRRYIVVHDCGPMLNPSVVEGQVYGGVAQGIGGAFFERIAYSEDGQLENANFMDFLIPYATEVPHIEVHHLETPSPSNPLGVKGVGEAGVIPVSAVIANALEDAIGVPVDEMPMSPSQLFQLMHPATPAPPGRQRRGARYPEAHRSTT